MRSNYYISFFKSFERLNRLRRDYINVKEQVIEESTRIFVASL